MEPNSENYQILDRYNVPRETYKILEHYRKLVVNKNKQINLISNKTEVNFIERHTIDCIQAIDFIDINSKICTDIGSGAGLPGIVLAAVLKGKNIKIKMNLYEKSYQKSSFLRQISEKLNLDVKVFQKNIFEEKNLNTDVIISRAFKPLPILLEIASTNFKNFKYIILFLGKSGKEVLKDALRNWKFDYDVKKSLTNEESLVIKISNLQKKNG